jgi:hypothetical protein
MNTLNRRMFMQQGGVVPSQTRLPPAQMMAPQMMDPSMMDPSMLDPSMLPPGATQQVVGNLMEQEGAALTDGIMSQVDSAQDYEELMNAIRGNELPIGDRRRELAELVGAPDAEQTPDSVLTLVQPTLSLVDAQGGLDSLMQEQANIAMEDGTGAPTPMAGGLGSMLMAGQPAEPVQMADGGVVPGDPTENPYITQMRELDPVFQELMGDTAGLKRKALGQTQLNFAGDILSSLYTPTAAPVGFLGRLGPAAGAFAKNLGSMGAAEQERADKMRAAQLGMAGQEVQSIRDQNIAAAAAQARIEAARLSAQATLDAANLDDIREDAVNANKLPATREERYASTLRNAEYARAYASASSDSSDSGMAARQWEQALQSRLEQIPQSLPGGGVKYAPPPPLAKFEMVPIIDRYGGDKRLLPPYLRNNASFVEAFDAAVLEFKKSEGGKRWYEAEKMADGGLVRKMADGSKVTPEDVRLLLEEQAAEEVALEEKKQTLSYWEEENPMALDVASDEYTQVPINVLTEDVFNKEYKDRNAPFDPAGVASGMLERYLLKPVSSAVETVTFQDPVTYYKDDELMKSHLLDLSALLRLRLPESVKSGSEGGDRRGMAVELADRFDARLLEGRHKVPSEVARVIKLETPSGFNKTVRINSGLTRRQHS